MKRQYIIYILLMLLSGCQTTSHKETSEDEKGKEAIANDFVNAFYSFKTDSLKSMLTLAKKSQPSILFYQKWAECGNYKIVKRGSTIQKNDTLLFYPVTVKDDLMGALDIAFNVTDTFQLAIKQGKIISVNTSSNDMPVYFEAKEWVKRNRPELVEKACEGIWDGGPTPCECVQGMIKGFADFKTKENKSNSHNKAQTGI